ncbi:MAG: sigma-70 family RNA polymerase sigma factor [Synergistaceae bacterium]|nr:sigma-70 family RNA polymerase sigma factor [Synergistaceae bacterium]
MVEAEPSQRLDPEREAVLWDLLAEGDERAREELILGYRSLVFWLARKLQVSPSRFPDLVQEGTLALITAVDHFDRKRNIKFITYAYYRIRGAMVNFLQRVEAKAPLPVEEMDIVAGDPFEPEAEDWRLSLQEGLERLSSRESEIIEALLVQGRRAKEIANEKGIDVSQIYRIQRKGLAKLRAWFGVGESTS